MNRIRRGESVTPGSGSALLRPETENVQHPCHVKKCESTAKAAGQMRVFLPSINMFAISKSSRIIILRPRTNKRMKEFAVAGWRLHYCSTKTTTKSLSANNQKAAVFSANGVMTWRVGAGVEREISDRPAL